MIYSNKNQSMESYENGTYDKEYLSSLPRFGKYEYVKGIINTLVYNMHDKTVCQGYKYHLYSDGVIGLYDYTTNESCRIMVYECISPNTFFTFPCEGFKDGETFAVLSSEECKKMRDLMDELLLQC